MVRNDNGSDRLGILIILYLLSHITQAKLVGCFNWLVAVELYFEHFFAANAIIKLIFQNEQNFPRFRVNHFSARRLCIFTIKTERNPSGHILKGNSC